MLPIIPPPSPTSDAADDAAAFAPRTFAQLTRPRGVQDRGDNDGDGAGLAHAASSDECAAAATIAAAAAVAAMNAMEGGGGDGASGRRRLGAKED